MQLSQQELSAGSKSLWWFIPRLPEAHMLSAGLACSNACFDYVPSHADVACMHSPPLMWECEENNQCWLPSLPPGTCFFTNVVWRLRRGSSLTSDERTKKLTELTPAKKNTIPFIEKLRVSQKVSNLLLAAVLTVMSQRDVAAPNRPKQTTAIGPETPPARAQFDEES